MEKNYVDIAHNKLSALYSKWKYSNGEKKKTTQKKYNFPLEFEHRGNKSSRVYKGNVGFVGKIKNCKKKIKIMGNFVNSLTNSSASHMTWFLINC